MNSETIFRIHNSLLSVIREP